MSDRKPGSNKPSWKNNSGANFSRRQNGPGWKKEKTVKEKGVRVGGRTRRLIQFGVAFTTCVALIIALIYLLFPPRPAHIVLVGDDYAETLAVPQNVRGMNFLRSVRSLSGRETGLALWGSRRLNVGDVVDLGSDAGWKGKWDTLVSDLHKPNRDKTLLVCLSLHGGVDPDDGAYLLVGEGNGEANRLSLKEVLDKLSGIPRDKNVVLVLDGAQIDFDWPLGIVGNEFGRKLAEMKAEIEAIPNLWVIASCDSDQRSWASRTGRMSIFGEVFHEGLAGKGAGDTGRVTLAGLFNYVKTEVARRTGESWGATQTPVLVSAKPIAEAGRVQINVVAKQDDSAASAATTPPPAAVSRWAEYVALGRRSPTPAVYAPKEWRELRESIVRSEQLSTLGHPTKPERLDARIDELFKKIDERRFVELKNSERYSLAMGALAGRSLAAPTAPTPAEFAAFWTKAPSDTLAKDWAALVGSAGEAEGSQLKTRFFDQAIGALSQTEGEELKSLTRIRSLIDALRPNPVPTEAHFAAMLDAHVTDAGRASPEFRALLPMAIGLRRRAERIALGAVESASSHSERIAPRVRALVEKADAERRRGEDLLFSSERADWTEADGLFRRARNGYEQAERYAADVRKVLDIRDRALADLPFLSRWAVDRISVVDSRDADLALADHAEKLWDSVHRLTAMADAGPEEFASLVKLAGDVEQGLKRLDDQHANDLGALDGNAGALAPDWSLADALAVPIPRKGERSAYVQPIRNRTAGSKGVDVASRNRKIRLQARMAMAELGQSWFDRNIGSAAGAAPAAGGPERFEAVRKRLDEALGEGLDTDGSKRGAAAVFVGDQIGRRYREMPRECDVLADGRAKVDVKRGLLEVRLAETLERLLPGFGRPERSPTNENRCRAVHDVLVTQANRSWTDHWFGDDPRDAPPYLAAGLAYLKDAAAFLKPTPEAEAVGRKLSNPGKLAFEPTETVSLTSESSLPLDYKIRPMNGAEIPDGTAVAWITPGRDIEVLPAASGKDHRRSVGFGAEAKPVALSIGSPLIPEIDARPSDRLSVDPSEVVAHGFFRGLRFESTTPVRIYPTPEVVMTSEVPAPFGTVTVRADQGVVRSFGRGSGALAIIFDASGSMKPAEGQDEKDSKIRQAKNALIAVLRRIPAGTAVRLWVYGEQTRPQGNPAAAGPNQVAMDRFGIRKLYEGVWSADAARRVSAEIDAVVPYGFTPLVRTMRYAAEDLMRLVDRPLKTMLVLTDGNDNPADVRVNPNAPAEEAEFRGGASIPNYLKTTFDKTGIRANVVFFGLDPALIGDKEREEQAQAESNLRVVEQFKPKGTFSLEHDPRKIVQLLLSGADQKLTYRLEGMNRKPVETLNGDPNLVSQSASEDAWQKPKLGAGVYAALARTDRELGQFFSIDNGDRLILKLGEAGFQRGLFSNDLLSDDQLGPDSKRKAESDGWRLSVLQNQWRDGLHILAGLERTAGLTEEVIKQPKPFNTWFEITTSKGRPGAGALRWSPVFGFPAPCFSFDAKSWPTDAAQVFEIPTIEAWWSSKPELPAPAVRLRKHEHFEDPLSDGSSGLSGRTVAVGDQSVVIERVEVQEANNLLIFRVRHPVGEPVMLRLEGLSPARQEHRFYQAAGKYTAVFSKVNGDGVKNDLTGLGIVSINQLKREAAARKNYVKLSLDSPPSGNEGRPSEVPLD